MHGWIILDKPVGIGSTPCVSAVKRALRDGGYAKAKVGHGGTLDPLASGVLPIAIGEATKLAGRLLDSDKVYDFTIRFGEQTDTLDAEGKVVATSAVIPTASDIAAVLPRFTGPIEQAPPAYSALKIDGKRAYDLARDGKDVCLAKRIVTVNSLSIRPERSRGIPSARAGVATTLDTNGLVDAVFYASVSKGTYIRSLARDIARALGTVGHITMLRRTRAGPFGLDRVISLDLLAEKAKGRALEEVILPLTAGLDDIPALPVSASEAAMLRQGRALAGFFAKHGLHLATEGQTPVALVEITDGDVRVVRGFNL